MSARRGIASSSARAKRQKARTAARRRRERAAEREALTAQIEALIEQLDVLDGDVDLEDEPEFAGVDLALLATRGIGDASDAEDTHDAEGLTEDDEDSGGEDLSQGYGYPPGSEDDAEPDFDNERSHNAPVSETILGEAALVPRSAPNAVDWSRAECLPGLSELPDGYVAMRVLSSRAVER